MITGNTFTGSYSDNTTPLATAQAFGNINVSANALPAIQLSSVSNLTISNNSFFYPRVQTYASQIGSKGNNLPLPVCSQNGVNPSSLCLSGNAIRLNNTSSTTISSNTVAGALDEAFCINNTSSDLLIDRNMISNMRMGPDSNIGTAIITGQNQGTLDITISNNTIINNSPGVYPVITTANQSNALGAMAAFGGYHPLNTIDPIEVVSAATARTTHAHKTSKPIHPSQAITTRQSA